MEKPTSQSAAEGAESAQVRDRGDRVRRRLRWRCRWWCGWGLMVVGLVLGAITLWSGWYHFQYSSPSVLTNFSGGLLRLRRLEPAGVWAPRFDVRPRFVDLRGSWDRSVPDAAGEPGAKRFLLNTVGHQFFDYGYQGGTSGGPRWDFHLLVWPWSAGLMVLSGLVLWWSVRQRSAARGQRCGCGYDLSGLPANAPCPECGTARVVEVKT